MVKWGFYITRLANSEIENQAEVFKPSVFSSVTWVLCDANSCLNETNKGVLNGGLAGFQFPWVADMRAGPCKLFIGEVKV